jgi:hypothetical protein
MVGVVFCTGGVTLPPVDPPQPAMNASVMMVTIVATNARRIYSPRAKDETKFAKAAMRMTCSFFIP